MADSIFTAASFLLAIAGFLCGIGTGWLLWRRAAGTPPAAAPIADLDAVESEIKAARALLDEDRAATQDYSEALADLDGAIKRANGRL
ncbi:MAG: hypothetical protein AB7P23_06410 [Amphiplicatus sp.]